MDGITKPNGPSPKFRSAGTFSYSYHSENTRFLGRPYSLRVWKASFDEAELLRRSIHLRSRHPEDPYHNRSILDYFYIVNAGEEFETILERALLRFRRFRIDRPELRIKKMNLKLGGSLKEKNRIYLNLDLIKVSRRSIEYVVYHELCHLVHPNHDQDFQECMDTMMPDWRQRKRRLVRNILKMKNIENILQ